MKKAIVSTLAASMLVFAIGCTNNIIGPKQSGAPTVPSELSMTIPSMGTATPAAQTLQKSTADSNAVFVLAYTAVSYWSINIQASLVKPVELFKLCRIVKPTALADNSGWKWVVSNATDSAVLIARVDGDSARYSMTVTTGALKNFTWFDGTATITGKVGYWTFYDTAAGNPGFYRFAYDFTDATNGQLTVTNIKSGDKDFGSYMKWSSAGRTKSFEAYGSAKPEKYLITWDEFTEAGSLTDVLKNVSYCWDSKLYNHRTIACQ